MVGDWAQPVLVSSEGERHALAIEGRGVQQNGSTALKNTKYARNYQACIAERASSMKVSPAMVRAQ